MDSILTKKLYNIIKMNELERNLSVEEFKFVKERIVTFEKRREQAVLLNITAFAAIIGFSDKVPHNYIPLLTLSILIFTSFTYSYSLILQNFCTSYLIEKNESSGSYLFFEKGYYYIFFEREDTPVPVFLYFLIEPYYWFVCMNIIINYVYFFSKNSFRFNYYDSFYYFIVIYGHLLVLFCTKFSPSRNISFFRERWRSYLMKLNYCSVKCI